VTTPDVATANQLPSGLPGEDRQSPVTPRGEGISTATLRRVERATGGMATRAVAMMDDRLSWFRTLTAEERSWVTLVAQAGIGGYVRWVESARAELRLTDSVFGSAPRDLQRSVSLRRTVELVRVAIDVAEERIPALGGTPAEVVALRDSLLRYSREIAFAAAAVYATAAETRGAWDARVEAALVDGIVRGEPAESLASRAAALGWDPVGPVAVLVGTAGTGRETRLVADWAQQHHLSALSGVQGGRLVIVLNAWPTEDGLAGTPGGRAALLRDHPFPADVESLFGDGPIVHGPPAVGLAGAVRSAEEAFGGLRVAHAWNGGTRLLSAGDLLVERVLAGDLTAIRRLRDTVYAPLAAASTPLLETLDGYLDHGAALEPAARSLFIHPNTLRYRLHRVAELTGADPWNARDVAVLRVALILGRLHRDGLHGSPLAP
jgi:sugar diacid utilization regulator